MSKKVYEFDDVDRAANFFIILNKRILTYKKSLKKLKYLIVMQSSVDRQTIKVTLYLWHK
jgi:hypothetical protein